MRYNPKKTKSMVVSRSRIIASGYDDLTLGSAEIEEVKSPRILEVTLNFKLTFEAPMREVVSKVARSLGVVHRAVKSFDCPRVLKSYFNAYVWYSKSYFNAYVWYSLV